MCVWEYRLRSTCFHWIFPIGNFHKCLVTAKGECCVQSNWIVLNTWGAVSSASPSSPSSSPSSYSSSSSSSSSSSFSFICIAIVLFYYCAYSHIENCLQTRVSCKFLSSFAFLYAAAFVNVSLRLHLFSFLIVYFVTLHLSAIYCQRFYFILSLLASSLCYSFRKRFTGCYLISVRFSSPALLAMFSSPLRIPLTLTLTLTSRPALVSTLPPSLPYSLLFALPTGKREWPQATTFSAIFMLFFRCFCSFFFGHTHECPVSLPPSFSVSLTQSLPRAVINVILSYDFCFA